jgi:pimeloyl-ACP methyl ester carboxylesterase
MTTFCLIHGNWHDGSSWTPVAERLTARGHRALTPDLPFDVPNATYWQRAQPAVEALEGVAGQIVVVGHSVGSAEAALVASKRDPALLVYVCPRLGSFPVGDDAPAVFREDFPFPARDDQGRMVWQPGAAAEAMYPRLPASTARQLASRLRPGASPADDYPLSAHPDVPTALIYTTEDEFFMPEWERYAARTLLDIEPIEMPGGHFPMQEHPDMLCDLLEQLAADHA